MAGDHPNICDDLMRFKPEGMSPNGWAMKAGVSRTVWSDMRRHGNPSRRTLEKLLTAAGSSLAEFEALRIGGGSPVEGTSATGLSDRSATWGGAQLPPLSLIATAIGGEWGDATDSVELTELRAGEVVDRVPRPISLANDASAYAITIVGDSMWPRFRPGRRLAVSARLPVSIGDDVVVKLASPSGEAVPALIKELVRRNGRGLDLRQFNPDTTFHVPAAEIAGIEKVLGELV
jgi:hypothetical protein